MKKFLNLSFVVFLAALIFSCASMKGGKLVSGKVASIAFGKDGYTAKINTDKNKVYFAVISIVNVGGPQNYKQLKVGEEVSLKGEIWKTETENHITVKEIVSVK
ncbi:MAG: hypothetical protein ABI554_04645 [Flavobacterium sp.]